MPSLPEQLVHLCLLSRPRAGSISPEGSTITCLLSAAHTRGLPQLEISGYATVLLLWLGWESAGPEGKAVSMCDNCSQIGIM